MDLVSRLKQYLDSRQISITQFADECGIPRPTGSQLLAGRNKKVSDEIISKIHAAYPDLNIVWLMFGEGYMVTGTPQNSSEKIQAPVRAPEAPATFTFASPAEPPVPPTPGSRPAETPDAPDEDSITLTPGKGKRVTGIVVYYDDCTYESFIPDPAHGHPFMR